MEPGETRCWAIRGGRLHGLDSLEGDAIEGLGEVPRDSCAISRGAWCSEGLEAAKQQPQADKSFHGVGTGSDANEDRRGSRTGCGRACTGVTVGVRGKKLGADKRGSLSRREVDNARLYQAGVDSRERERRETAERSG